MKIVGSRAPHRNSAAGVLCGTVGKHVADLAHEGHGVRIKAPDTDAIREIVVAHGVPVQVARPIPHPPGVVNIAEIELPPSEAPLASIPSSPAPAGDIVALSGR